MFKLNIVEAIALIFGTTHQYITELPNGDFLVYADAVTYVKRSSAQKYLEYFNSNS